MSSAADPGEKLKFESGQIWYERCGCGRYKVLLGTHMDAQWTGALGRCQSKRKVFGGRVSGLRSTQIKSRRSHGVAYSVSITLCDRNRVLGPI